MTVPLRAALYLRVSTARQAEHDVSIPDQKRQGEAYCASRGYQLVETYVEPGASATNDRRPEFQRMIEAGTSKPAAFDVVIVHSFSRFFRDHFELEFYVRKLAKNGVRLLSITQEMGDDPMHVMMRQIMALFDEYQATFDAVQAHLKARNPKVTPPRVVSGPTLLTGICFCGHCNGAMTIRTGKSGRYRYYACSIKARQGETGCTGQAIPMDKLDTLVASYIEDRLLAPERLEEVLASVIDRRQDHAERGREHIAELNKRAAEAELRLKRLYDAIEAGVADLDDPALKDRIVGLKANRDQAQANAQRTQAMLESATHQSVTPQMLRQFASIARKRMHLDRGGYRRDHLRLLAQRVEVEDKEIRIMGSKSNLLRTLAAISNSGVKSETLGVPSFVPKWRTGWDSNPRWA